MLKIFRSIRKDQIRSRNARLYLLYAIGEIILVVLGILIALQVNNWNEDRKQNNKRDILVENLISDFESTLSNIHSTKRMADQLLDDMNLFYEIQHYGMRVSVDSLKKLALSFFRLIPFQASLSSYEQAEYTGELGLLKKRELFVSINEFKSTYRTIEELQTISLQSYFSGSAWDFRKTIGSVYQIVDASFLPLDISPPMELALPEYLRLLNTPIAAAAFENSYLILVNYLNGLQSLEESTEDILEILKTDDN